MTAGINETTRAAIIDALLESGDREQLDLLLNSTDYKALPTPIPTHVEINSATLSRAPIRLKLNSFQASCTWAYFVVALIVLIGGALGTYFWAREIGTIYDVGPMALADGCALISIILIICGCRKAYATPLLSHWDSSGEDHDQYEEIRERLETWIKDEVPDPTKYNHMKASAAKEASLLMQTYLQNIVRHLDHESVSKETRERVLLALYDASNVCAPTWLEVAKKQCRVLQGGESGEQSLLRYVQQAKEDLVLEIAQRDFNGQWHDLSIVRKLAGKELGLDMSTMAFDAGTDSAPKVTKEEIMQLCKEHLTADVLIKRVRALIMASHLDPKDTGIDLDLMDLLSSCAEKHAKSQPSFNESDFDSGTYVMEKFYTKSPDGKKHFITEEAVKLLLLEIKVLK